MPANTNALISALESTSNNLSSPFQNPHYWYYWATNGEKYREGAIDSALGLQYSFPLDAIMYSLSLEAMALGVSNRTGSIGTTESNRMDLAPFGNTAFDIDTQGEWWTANYDIASFVTIPLGQHYNNLYKFMIPSETLENANYDEVTSRNDGVGTTIGIWPSQFYGLGVGPAPAPPTSQHRWAYFTKAINDDWGTGNSLRFRVADDSGWWSDDEPGEGHNRQVGSANFSTGTGLEQLCTSELDTNGVMAAYDADATWPSWLIGFYGRRDAYSTDGYTHESWVYVTDPSLVPETTSFTVLSTTYVDGGVTKNPVFTLKSGGWTQVSGSDSAVYKRQLQHSVPAGTVTYNNPNSSGTLSYTVVADNASGRPMLILDSMGLSGYVKSVMGPGSTQTATSNNHAFDNSDNGDGSGRTSPPQDVNNQPLGFKSVSNMQIIRISTTDTNSWVLDTDSSNGIDLDDLYLLGNNMSWCWHNLHSFRAWTDFTSGYWQTPKVRTPGDDGRYPPHTRDDHASYSGDYIWSSYNQGIPDGEWIGTYHPQLANDFNHFTDISYIAPLYDAANTTFDAQSILYASLNATSISTISNNAPFSANNTHFMGDDATTADASGIDYSIATGNEKTMNTFALWLYTANGYSARPYTGDAATRNSRPQGFSNTHPAASMTVKEVYDMLLAQVNNYTYMVRSFIDDKNPPGDYDPLPGVRAANTFLYEARDWLVRYGDAASLVQLKDVLPGKTSPSITNALANT